MENLKDFLSHAAQPTGLVAQSGRSTLAADLLAPCSRFTPRLICQATGGSLGTVSDMLDTYCGGQP